MGKETQREGDGKMEPDMAVMHLQARNLGQEKGTGRFLPET